MKTTTNANELQEIGACIDDETCGLPKFLEIHGEDKEVKFSEGLKSNGWDDFWWFIGEVCGDLSKRQGRDLKLLACDYAEDALHIYEAEHDSPHPRNAIQMARTYTNELIDRHTLDMAYELAWSVVETSLYKPAFAARAAMWSTGMYHAPKHTWYTARDANLALLGRRREWQEQKLMDLLLKWEEENN